MNQLRFLFLIQQTSSSSVLATDCALAWKLTRHSHYVQEWQMIYRQESVHSHLNNVIFGKKVAIWWRSLEVQLSLTFMTVCHLLLFCILCLSSTLQLLTVHCS